MKCGSSSLRDFLMQHPQITILKAEGNFFNVEENYKKGTTFYREQFLELNASEKNLWGEKTVDYSYLPGIAERIYDYNPKMKLIWILRNPVNRTYSNYLHEFKRGEETLDFKSALDREMANKVENIYHYYLKRSSYSIQINEYLNFFSKDQMHFILFEDLIRDSESMKGKLGNFLAVDLTELEYKPTNITMLPRFPWLVKFSNNRFKNNFFIRKIISVFNTKFKTAGYTPMDEDIRNWLQKYFTSEVLELKKVVSLKLTKWGY